MVRIAFDDEGRSVKAAAEAAAKIIVAHPDDLKRTVWVMGMAALCMGGDDFDLFGETVYALVAEANPDATKTIDDALDWGGDL
jgi:hypothetical protein